MGIKPFQTCKQCEKQVEFTKKGVCFLCYRGEPFETKKLFTDKELLDKCAFELYQSEQRKIALVDKLERYESALKELENGFERFAQITLDYRFVDGVKQMRRKYSL
jgi:hypothetical protein